MTTVYWLTRDLRLDDNLALNDAAKDTGLVCVFMVDPRWFEPGPFGWPAMGPHRWAFLWQSLVSLQRSLEALGQRLLIRYQTPESGLPEVIRAVGARRLVASRPTAIHEWQQWRTLETTLTDVKCEFVETLTLFSEPDLPFDLSNLPETFSTFRRSIEKRQLGPVAPVNKPDTLPLPVNLAGLDQREHCPPVASQSSLVTGGEQAAFEHMKQYIWSAKSILTYKTTRNAIDDWASSSKLSSWLAMGCLSARRVAADIARFEVNVERNESTYWLYFELLWREYFQWYSRHRGSDLFRSPDDALKATEPAKDPVAFNSWLADIRTHDLVRAGRVQLETTGYLSNRMRQIMASACIHEGLFDWRLGAAWFEHFLIDYDVASNYGNWQYIAGVGADPRGGRMFSLEKQVRQFDADGRYRQRWLAIE
jgi:deoxyribodipyrimidine photo-lyase